MDLRKVYYATEDAFDSSRTINRIFRIYFDSINKANFVDNLRDTEKEDELGFPKEDLGRFMDANNATHFILFNKWMNDIRRISGLSVDEKNQFYQDVSRASYDIESRESDDPVLNTFRVKTAFNKIVNKVRKMGSVSQMKQINDFHKSFKDKDVARLFEILDYFSTDHSKDLINIRSNYLLTNTNRGVRDSVFIAVIPNQINVFEFVNEYLKKCQEYEVPYNVDIPYDKHTKQVVRINSTIEDLGKHLAVVQDIADSCPDMIKDMKQPPVLCGRIKDWIGIGTLSCKGMERTTFGFTEKRGKIIYDAIVDYSRKFIDKNYARVFAVDGKNKQLRDYISEVTAEIAIAGLRTMADEYYDQMERDYGHIEAEKQVKSYFGFNRRDLYEPKYLKKVRKNIYANVDDLVAQDFNPGDEFFKFGIPNSSFGFGRTIHLDIVPKVFRTVQHDILVRNPKFMNEVVREIKGRFKEQGIDEKTCFEDYVVEKMFEEDRKILKSQPLVENETTKAVENTTTKKVDKIEDK